MKGTKIKASARIVTPQEREAFMQGIERQYPGYIDENLKLSAIVKIFTGLRILYGLFYIGITTLYGLRVIQGIFIIFSGLIFYLWYSWMLRAGKGIAVLMLALRGFSIVSGGVSILEMSYWLPFPIIFTLTVACVLEFSEAVFCIYILFNKTAAATIRLNRGMDAQLIQAASSAALGSMADYKNPYTEETEPEEKPETQLENEKTDTEK